jgi:hypothetical protein
MFLGCLIGCAAGEVSIMACQLGGHRSRRPFANCPAVATPIRVNLISRSGSDVPNCVQEQIRNYRRMIA